MDCAGAESTGGENKLSQHTHLAAAASAGPVFGVRTAAWRWVFNRQARSVPVTIATPLPPTHPGLSNAALSGCIVWLQRPGADGPILPRPYYITRPGAASYCPGAAFILCLLERHCSLYRVQPPPPPLSPPLFHGARSTPQSKLLMNMYVRP